MRWPVISPAALPSRSAAGDAESPSGTAGEATVPEGEEAAREWADALAADAGYEWGKKWPTGKDW